MKKSDPARNRVVVLLSIFYLLPSTFCILLIRLYRLTLSPAKAFLFGPAAQCRFEPTCSQYAIEALKTHGAITGGWLAAKRVCRCHPWGGSGADPVPPRTVNRRSIPGSASVPLASFSLYSSDIHSSDSVSSCSGFSPVYGEAFNFNATAKVQNPKSKAPHSGLRISDFGFRI